MERNETEVNALTHKIIGCAMEVHNIMGNGFQEVIYQRALAIELGLNGIPFEREKEMDLSYKGEHIGTRRADFLVAGLVLVELKAVMELDGAHKAQAINYCEAYNLPDGLLINFGGMSLDFRRVYNKRLIKSWKSGRN
ncbi:MAG: GxxExxY protein [Bacteroidetes bacterium]|nr:GxxExxY protein [Bacteroidota bacterium]